LRGQCVVDGEVTGSAWRARACLDDFVDSSGLVAGSGDRGPSAGGLLGFGGAGAVRSAGGGQRAQFLEGVE
jgi:hypothetical protein